jgi:hypothetical protein
VLFRSGEGNFRILPSIARGQAMKNIYGSDEFLFITEVGSRMWEMADISSDYDMFYCYQTPATKYLRTGDFEPTRPQKHYTNDVGKEYDCQFMEIGHLVHLLMKGNVNAIWAVCSPVIHKDGDVLQKLKVIVRNNLSKDSYPSIKGIATSQYLDAERRADQRAPEKSLKTCLRSINFGLGVLYGRGIEFSPVHNATKTMCEHSFKYLDTALGESRLPQHPNCEVFEDFLFNIRLSELFISRAEALQQIGGQ